MIPDERRTQILSLLHKNHYMSVEDLSRQLYVSLPTIRRDLLALEKEGSIKRIHGGASFNNPDSVPSPYALRKKKNSEEKKIIGKKAASLIKNNDTLFISSSSTCLSFVNEINLDYQLKVLTNGMPLAHVLSKNEKSVVECPPGVYNNKHESIFGREVHDYILKRHAKYGFISCNGLDIDFGVSFLVDVDPPIVDAFRKSCDILVLLIDHTKFDQKFYYKALDLSQIDIIISDQPLSQKWVEACKKYDVRIL